ncbi:MAG: hypothetical protein KatS3mg095_0978 [Candidatus Parcubacteria bacterium]|nr:MAG: hypothetical protein KatS3mg095_0978 [Candidatus Parcubacteria bacterium]
MIEIIYTKKFEKYFDLLPNSIKKKALKKIKLFEQQPFSPILRTEKLRSFENIWSFRIDKKYRVIFSFIGSRKAIFYLIGHHHWIYKLLK